MDSQELTAGSWGPATPATSAFDGSTNTFWNTAWFATQPPYPHEIQINLGAVYGVGGFRSLPRQDGLVNGRIAGYEFYLSLDGTNWGSSVANGTFTNNAQQTEVQFASTNAQYVRLRALSSQTSGDFTASLAELNVLTTNNLAPDSQITSPSANTSITVGNTVTFAGSGSDPENNVPLTYLWNFGSGSGLPNSTNQNPGALNFTNAGTFTVTLTVSDALGAADATPATRTITVLPAGLVLNPIPQSGWSLKFVDSEELTAGSWGPATPATSAFDGNTNTFWNTAWFSTQPPYPHEIQINLGAQYGVGGFRSLPRQDGRSNGRIAGYEFYLSLDGTNWGSSVASGTFSNIAQQTQVQFIPNTAQFVRLRALSSQTSGDLTASLAELNVLTTNNLAADSQITSPSANTTITVGNSVNFTGSGSDPENNLPLTYLWNFGSGSGLPNSTNQNPGALNFTNTGTFLVTLTVSDSLGAADPTPATRTITVLPAGLVLNPIPQSGWSLKFVDSEELTAGSWGPATPATNAFDGNTNTFWNTAWFSTQPPYPHEIQINLGAVYGVGGFRSLPRQDGRSNGRIAGYEFYLSMDGTNWGSTVASGTFSNIAQQTQVQFAPNNAQFVRLRAMSSQTSGDFTASLAEINVLTTNNLAPDSQITSPSANTTITVGNTITFTGSGSDPENNLPLTYLWSFGAGSGLPNSTNQNPGALTFTNAGTFTVTFTVSDALGAADPTPATRTITVLPAGLVLNPIPQSGWSLKFVDSQELTAGSWGPATPATNAFDGKTNTFWNTAWFASQPAYPHEMQIDLGATYGVGGFRQLPRQDGLANGRIAGYEFYLSLDGTNWGSSVASGTFTNNAQQTQVQFVPNNARFVRFRAMSSQISGDFTASMAEINVLTTNNLPPDSQITAPSGDVTITAGGAVSFAGSGSDPENNLPLVYHWSFGSGSGLPDSSAQNPGSLSFTNTGTFSVTLTVSDSLGATDPTPATRTITVLPAGLVMNPIPQSGWSLKFVDSQELNSGSWGPATPATNAFDGKTNTFWNTAWFASQPPYPHELQINLGATYGVGGFRHLPRQDGLTNGRIAGYEFYLSLDGTNWSSAVASGTFANTASQTEVQFNPNNAQFVRFRPTSSQVVGDFTASLAELNVLTTNNLPPDGQIISPSNNVTISVGDSVTFAGSGTDPENNLPLVYHWSFGAGSGLAGSTVQNPGALSFQNPGTFTVALTVNDSLGQADPTPATRIVSVQNAALSLIPQTNWVLKYVDSQELTAGSWGPPTPATNAFDGKSNTFWNTAWYATQPPYPHEIQIDLAGVYNIAGFQQLPRQDGSANGRIANYGFYTSMDGTNWGAAVVSGTFSNTAAQTEIQFPPLTGRFVRFQALSAQNGADSTASIAELHVLSSGGPINLAPQATINSPTGNVTITVGESVNFAGSGTDPDNDTPLSYLWSFGAGSGISNSILQNPGLVQFTNIGNFAINFYVTDARGLVNAAPAARNINVLKSNVPPNGVIITQTNNPVIGVGDWVHFAGAASDPNQDWPFSYQWSFGAGSGVAGSTDPDAGNVQFNQPGTFTVTFTASNASGAADPTPDTRTVTVINGPLRPVPRAGFSLRYVDSQETRFMYYGGLNGSATQVYDGNINSLWHTQEVNAQPPLPHEIQLDLGGTYNLCGFRYLPPQDGFEEGRVGQFEFYVSSDGTNWGAPVATGRFANEASEKQVLFVPTNARYVRFRALSEVNDLPFTAMAELTILQSGTLSNQAPSGSIVTPATDVTITPGSAINFTSTGSDPDGNLPLQFRWNFGSNSGIDDQNIQNPGLIRFDNPGVFTVSCRVADSWGLQAAAAATRTITVQDFISIPKTNWSLVYVDSEELTAGAWGPATPATNIFDGSSNTFWSSRWFNAQDPMPHEVQIDLGAIHSELSGFQAVPRQDLANGRILDYEFYVSQDGTNWNAPVAVGTFANSFAVNTVYFPRQSGRYVRLRAITAENGTFEACLAELNVLELPCVTPSVQLLEPMSFTLQEFSNLTVVANACLDTGQGVRVVLDGSGPSNGVAQVDLYQPPYSVQFTGVSAMEHIVDVYVIDAGGGLVSGVATHGQARQVAVGDSYVAVGDSITSGVDDSVREDNASRDGRNIQGGFTPLLQDALTTATGRPTVIYNEAIPGTTAAQGAALISSLLLKYPRSKYFFIMYGANDSTAPVPSGLGLNPGDSGYTNSFKDSMQQIITAVVTAGRFPLLAKTAPVLPLDGAADQSVQTYNLVVDELVANAANQIHVTPPNFYTYFRTNLVPEFGIEDHYHPNGIGYHSMAGLWLKALGF